MMPNRIYANTRTCFISMCCILLSVGCLYTSCSRTGDKVSTSLAQVEELLWHHPDSALSILKSIPNPELLVNQEQADYALLLTLTQYRCNIPIPSDSLINIAAHYYNKKNNLNKKGEIYYIKGAIAQESFNDIPQALTAYKKAESLIPQIKNKQFVSRIYSSLGFINNKAHHYQLAKEYYKKALRINSQIGNINSKISNFINLSSIYYHLNQVDSTDWCINQLIQIADSTLDLRLKAKAYHNIAIRKRSEAKYEEAEKYFLQALRISTPASFPYKTLVSLGKLYGVTNRKEEAEQLLRKALRTADLSSQASVYDYLYKEAIAAENYQKATEYAVQYIAITDSIQSRNLYKEVLGIQKEYDRMELLYQNSELKNRWLFTVIITIFVLLGIAYGFRRYKKKMQMKTGSLKQEISLLQERLMQEKAFYESKNNLFEGQRRALQSRLHTDTTLQKNEQEILENQINRLAVEQAQSQKTYREQTEALLQRINALEQKNKESEGIGNQFKLLYGTDTPLLNPTDIKALQTAQQLIQNLTYLPCTDRSLLMHWLNLSRNGFAAELERTYPLLKEHYLDICYFTALGLSIDEIAQVLDVNMRTIERYMSQICIEIKFPQHGKKGFLAFINAQLSLK
ncbi:MAG: tetratricopeptide repeat protein [Bacteroides sp.]|uniref:tetratricopeptide repeat protein n=1 Tax=Bacteroides sp. TaxID=29523 RepID=UPI002FC94896